MDKANKSQSIISNGAEEPPNCVENCSHLDTILKNTGFAEVKYLSLDFFSLKVLLGHVNICFKKEVCKLSSWF